MQMLGTQLLQVQQIQLLLFETFWNFFPYTVGWTCGCRTCRYRGPTVYKIIYYYYFSQPQHSFSMNPFSRALIIFCHALKLLVVCLSQWTWAPWKKFCSRCVAGSQCPGQDLAHSRCQLLKERLNNYRKRPTSSLTIVSVYLNYNQSLVFKRCAFILWLY